MIKLAINHVTVNQRTAPCTLVDIERSNWAFKVTNVGKAMASQWTKFRKDVVGAIYFLNVYILLIYHR